MEKKILNHNKILHLVFFYGNFYFVTIAMRDFIFFVFVYFFQIFLYYKLLLLTFPCYYSSIHYTCKIRSNSYLFTPF